MILWLAHPFLVLTTEMVKEDYIEGALFPLLFIFKKSFGHTTMHEGSKFPNRGSNLLAWEEWSLNHWTTREVPRSLVKISLKMDMKV